VGTRPNSRNYFAKSCRQAEYRVPNGQNDTVFQGQPNHAARMADGDPAELYAKWMAAENIGRFRELLDAETEDGKFKILAQLLSYELEQLKKASRSGLKPPNGG
jgi:hypothetical protein